MATERAKRPTQTEREVVVTLRLPRDLHARLKELGGERGLTAQIRDRLDASLAMKEARSDDPWFADVLIAIGHAAAGAVKLKQNPILPPDTWERDGKRRSYDVARWGQDTTAYETFVHAAHALMVAFAPEGVPAVSQETGLRLADQLVGLALGALGERGIAAFSKLPPMDREAMRQSGGAAQPIAEAVERDANEGEAP